MSFQRYIPRFYFFNVKLIMTYRHRIFCLQIHLGPEKKPPRNIQIIPIALDNCLPHLPLCLSPQNSAQISENAS